MAESKHFKEREFRCPHCGVARAVPELVGRLEKLRTLVGKPIPIVSGYRCPVHNAAVGGAPNSQHMLGKAADIPAGIATPAQAARAGFTGIGNKGRWAIHVDTRKTPARWTY